MLAYSCTRLLLGYFFFLSSLTRFKHGLLLDLVLLQLLTIRTLIRNICSPNSCANLERDVFRYGSDVLHEIHADQTMKLHQLHEPASLLRRS